MRRFKVFSLVAFALAALSFASLANQMQRGGLGAIEGLVLDQAGVPVVQAKVEACNVFQGGCVSTLSQSNGFYRIKGLAAGRYSLWAEANRYGSVWMPLIVVDEGQITRQDIELRREIPTFGIQPPPGIQPITIEE